MIVKISRSKLLINSQGSPRRTGRVKKPVVRCNHCGGLIRQDGELEACIMCTRAAGHSCNHCSHTPPAEVTEKDKKRA